MGMYDADIVCIETFMIVNKEDNCTNILADILYLGLSKCFDMSIYYFPVGF